MGTSCEGSGDGGGRTFPSSPPSSSSRREQCGVKRGMVEMELDAARTLADLAGMAVPTPEMEMGVDSAGSSNGERDCYESSDSKSKKRSKSESPVRAQDRNLKDPNSSKSEENLNGVGREGYVVSQGRIEQDMRARTQHDYEVINLNVCCPAGDSSGTGGRGKQNLTEAEKEARRLRRILANRESARQTIRRRQALREELTRRVADLSIENKNMKMEKEHVLKEYLSLRDRNEQLKEQIARTEKAVCASSAEAESSSSSPSTPPFIMYGNSPFVPHVMHSWLSTSPDASALYGHGNPSSSAGAVSLYAPPCAWYYPFDRELAGTCAQNLLSVGDRIIGNGDRRQPVLHPYLPMGGEDKSHISDSKHETLFTAMGTRDVLERMHGDQKEVTSSSEENDMLSMTIGLSLEDKGESRRATGVQERPQRACARSPEIFVNVAAAAEARRRRKELTKLKNHSGR